LSILAVPYSHAVIKQGESWRPKIAASAARGDEYWKKEESMNPNLKI
jgi:hypothetical protein